MNDYDYIHKATDAQLADMLEDLSHHEITDKREMLEEAARRLRARQRIPFNNEQFE